MSLLVGLCTSMEEQAYVRTVPVVSCHQQADGTSAPSVTVVHPLGAATEGTGDHFASISHYGTNASHVPSLRGEMDELYTTVRGGAHQAPCPTAVPHPVI